MLTYPDSHREHKLMLTYLTVIQKTSSHRENKMMFTHPHSHRKNKPVFTHPQSQRENKLMFTQPQSQRENKLMLTHPHSHWENKLMLTHPHSHNKLMLDTPTSNDQRKETAFLTIFHYHYIWKHGALRPQKPLRLIREGEVDGVGNFYIYHLLTTLSPPE